METKNEQQKQNLIWISIVLILVTICSLLFLQNKKIERIMTMINMNYDPYGFSFGMHHRPNSDIYLIEKRINEKFMEFTREMDKLKHLVDNTINDNLDSYREKVDNETIKENKTAEADTKKNVRNGKVARKSGNREKNSKNSQFKVKTNYDKEDKEYKVEISLPNNFAINDVSITLKNSILQIRIEKEFNKENKNSSYYNYDSFYQSFTIPKTKATTKDIIKKIEDGKLEIKVPIK